jgi:SAM-dependent methyltransferase
LDRRLNDAELHYLYNHGRCAYGFRNLYIATAEARAQRIYRPKATLLSPLTDGRRLLDFGCSAGYFMRTARELGWDVHGVELNSFAVEWARDTLGMTTVKDCLLADCGYKPNEFDVVTMWDVVEHLPEPLAALQEIRPLIAAGGALVLETSHWDCLETQYLGPDNTNVEGDAHLMHFTKRSLETLLGLAGFRIERFDIFGLDLAHIVQFEKRRKLQRNSLDPALLQTLQKAVDIAGLGCYIRAVARPLV